MKLKILVVIQSIILIFFILLSIIKSSEVEIALVRAEEQSQLASEMRIKADEEVQRAEKIAAEVIIAQIALEKCQSGN